MAIMAAAASRNLCPVVLVLAPVAAWRLSVAFAGPRPRPVPDGLAPVIKPAAFVIGGIGLVFCRRCGRTIRAAASWHPTGESGQQIAANPGETESLTLTTQVVSYLVCEAASEQELCASGH